MSNVRSLKVAMVSGSDQAIFAKALAYIRRSSMHESDWRFTLLGVLHPQLAEFVNLTDEEQVVVSSVVPSGNWYVFTTRRFLSSHAGVAVEFPAIQVTLGALGNFKGFSPGQAAGSVPTEIGTVVDALSGAETPFEFETFFASMAPIYACKFWAKRAKMARLTSAALQRESTGT